MSGVAAQYDPYLDLAARFPRWKLRTADLDAAGEMICPGSSLVLVHESYADQILLAAHVVAHLDLHMDALGLSFSEAQEEDALWLAMLRLDREVDRDDLLRITEYDPVYDANERWADWKIGLLIWQVSQRSSVHAARSC